jgi:hypothetical protein
VTDFRDHIVQLIKLRNRHGLSRCCDGQGKDNSSQPDHSFLLCEGPHVEPRAKEVEASTFMLDLRVEGQLEAVFEQI